jgi:aminoglycoside phosphotransferase (APT) family kinase protein
MTTEPRLPEADTPRPGDELDTVRVESYLSEHLEGFEGPLEIRQFTHGSANLTYLLTTPNGEYVLRRPPRGTLAPGAHDMAREYKVLSRLWKHFPPAPRAYLFCEDSEVAGANFFVAERRTGVVIQATLPPELEGIPDVGRRVSFALVEAMAEFHDVDYESAGLADLGRPEGFTERQLTGWRKRWDLAKFDDDPLFDQVGEELGRRMPSSPGSSLVHNDLKLDNCQFQPGDPDRVTSIFDWDMTTLGDPLVDLGTLLGYWGDPGDEHDRTPSGNRDAIPGLPLRQEIAERYSERRQVSLDTIAWYEAFALWKTCVVVQQLHARFVNGQSSNPRHEHITERIPGLLRMALSTVQRAPLT